MYTIGVLLNWFCLIRRKAFFAMESSDSVDDFAGTEIKLTMWIPAELGGRVVGKKGVVISNIQRETHCKLMHALAPIGSSLWIAVVIMGSSSSVQAAYKAVSGIVSNQVDGVVAEIRFNRTKHAFLQGFRGGPTVRKTSAETNVRLFIPDKDSSPQDLQITLEGECDNVFRAISLFSAAYIESKTPRDFRFRDSEAASKDKAQESNHASRSTVQPGHDASPTPTPISLLPPAAASTQATQVAQPVPRATQKSAPISTSTAVQPLVAQDQVPKPAVTETAPSSSSAPAPTNNNHSSATRVTKIINIPSSIVGLLLARRPDTVAGKPKRNVINQIQLYTGAIISRVNDPPPRKAGTTAHSANKASDVATDTSSVPVDKIASGTVGDDSSSDDDLNGEPASDAVVAADVDESISAAEQTQVVAGSNVVEDVPFKIVANSVEAIVKTEQCFAEILGGVRIKDVLTKLKESWSAEPTRKPLVGRIDKIKQPNKFDRRKPTSEATDVPDASDVPNDGAAVPNSRPAHIKGNVRKDNRKPDKSGSNGLKPPTETTSASASESSVVRRTNLHNKRGPPRNSPSV